jgi:hypothetical protein
VQAVLNCDEPDNTKIVEGFRSRKTGIANFVGSAVRLGVGPTKEQLSASHNAFRPRLKKHRPARLVVCSRKAWGHLSQD